MNWENSSRSRSDYMEFLSARGSLFGLQQSVFIAAEDQATIENTEGAYSKLNGEYKKKRLTNIQNSMRAARAVEMAYWRQSEEMQSSQQPSTSANEDTKTKPNVKKFGSKKDTQTPDISLIYYLRQLQALEKIYSETRYLPLSNQATIAAELCLTEPQVRYWFHCRREVEKQGENKRTRWDNYDFWSHLKRASGDFSDDED